jgi:hypothetical protein
MIERSSSMVVLALFVLSIALNLYLVTRKQEGHLTIVRWWEADGACRMFAEDNPKVIFIAKGEDETLGLLVRSRAGRPGGLRSFRGPAVGEKATEGREFVYSTQRVQISA